MTPSTASLPSKKAETAAAVGAQAPRLALPWGWPDRVGGAQLGRSWPPLSKAAGHQAAQNRAALTALLLLLALVTAGVALATRHGSDGQAPPAEKTLLAVDSSPNLNPTSAEAPPRLTVPEPIKEPEMTLPQWHSDHAVGLPPSPSFPLSRELATMEAEAAQGVQTPEPAPPPAPVQEPLPFPAAVPVVEDHAPVANLALIPTQPVESTMMRTWKALGYQAILLAAFSAGPSVAAPEDPGDKPATAKDIEKLDKSLRFMADKVADSFQKTQTDIESLKKQVADLQKEVDGLKKRGPQTTTNFKPANAGRLELTNDYPYPIDIVVNDAGYQLAPGMTRVLNLPTGATFNYRIPSIPGYQMNLTRTLDGDRPYKITVYPMQ